MNFVMDLLCMYNKDIKTLCTYVFTLFNKFQIKAFYKT
jgi:hypothetical protein